MLIYSVIGLIMFAITIWSIRLVRYVDGKDVFVSLVVFGVLWPVGAFWMLMMFIDVINKTRK